VTENLEDAIAVYHLKSPPRETAMTENIHRLYGGVQLKLTQLQERLAWYPNKNLTPEQIELLIELEDVIDELEELYDDK